MSRCQRSQGLRPTASRSDAFAVGLAAVITLLLAFMPTTEQALAVGTPDCQRQTQTDPPGTNLDDRAIGFFGVFCEDRGNGAATGEAVKTVIDGRSALECRLLGGGFYGGVHCFTNLADQSYGAPLTFGVDFKLPSGTCANTPSPSLVQALEFSMSRYKDGRRWEWALQLENVPSTPGDGAPRWRRWVPASQTWRDTPYSVPQDVCDGGEWHTFAMRGRISAAGGIHFDAFTLDGEIHELGSLPDAAAVPQANEPDRYAAAVQLDANSLAGPYAVGLDRWSLIVPADTTAPTTTIAKHPRKTIVTTRTNVSVAFSFTGTDKAAGGAPAETPPTFQCKTRGGAFKSCRSPFKYKVGTGPHTFKVRAVDAAGNKDATPATFRFNVKTRRARAAFSQRMNTVLACKTRSAAEKAIGLHLQRLGEPCAYRLPPHVAPLKARCPRSWVCQLHEVDDNHNDHTIRLGVGQPVMVVGGTWRYARAYPLADPIRRICRFLKKVPSSEVYVRAKGQPRCPHKTRTE